MKRGDEFTHESILDPEWKPGPEQKHSDAPKARMVITQVTSMTVYYTFVGGTRGTRWLDRDAFEQRYGAQVSS